MSQFHYTFIISLYKILKNRVNDSYTLPLISVYPHYISGIYPLYIRCESIGDLVKMKGILKIESYPKILKGNVTKYGNLLSGRNFICQQDNDPKH